MIKTPSIPLVLGFLVFTVACGGSGRTSAGGAGAGNPGGINNPGGTSSSNSSSSGAVATEPQGWVHILDPGQTADQENSDADGWCVGGEGVYACDDGATPGSGGTPPAGWNSSSSGTSGNTSSSTSSGGGNNSSNGGAASGGAPICENEQFNTGSRVTPQMLLVVDKSGSMDEVASGGSTKWTQIVRVLNSLTATLESRIDFGMALFPSGGSNSCSAGNVVVNIGGNRANDIAAALNNSGPGGGTPTGDSLQEALAYLRTRDTTRPRAVVLATDGAPNCSSNYDPATCVCTNAQGCDDSRSCLDDSGATGAVTALAAAGISTFVVGIPGTDAFAAVLDRMATAGGTALPGSGPRYYRTESEADLNNALDAISTRIAECRFQLRNPPDSGEPLTVTLDGQPINRAPIHNDGYDITGGNTLEFFGAACSRLSDGGNHTVAVQYCWRAGG
jgi:hypothetical protein